MQIIEKQQSFSQSLIWQFQHDISSEVHYLLGWSFKFQASALKKREKTSGVTDAPQLAFPTLVTATLLPNEWPGRQNKLSTERLIIGAHFFMQGAGGKGAG